MMPAARCARVVAAIVLVVPFARDARGRAPDAAEESITRFLAQDDAQPAYRAIRHLEAENGSRTGWLDAFTEYSPAAGFHYQITGEGGAGFIRGRVLKAVLEGERTVIAQGESSRSSLDTTNYTFQPKGIDDDGLAIVLLSPRRKERVLVSGTMALSTSDGALVRLQGRLAKSPSFWVKDVDIVRSYRRIEGSVLPVELESRAQLRFLGTATFRMTYVYLEIDGRKVKSLLVRWRASRTRDANSPPQPARSARPVSGPPSAHEAGFCLK